MTKRNSQGEMRSMAPLVIVTIISVLVAAGASGFAIWSNTQKNESVSVGKECPKCETDEDNSDEGSGNASDETLECAKEEVKFEPKVINDKYDRDYIMAAGFDIPGEKSLAVWQKESGNFRSFEYIITDTQGTKTGTFELEEDVRMVTRGDNGQWAGGAVIVFVLADGRVKYIPAYYSLEREKIILKDVEGVSDVMYATTGGVKPATVMTLWRANGEFYDFSQATDIGSSEFEKSLK